MRYVALFASSATVLCCGLPALLVFMGFGAVVASAVSSFPFLIVLSQHKLAVFSASALIILLAWTISNTANACPIDEQKHTCQRLKKVSHFILMLSTVLWVIGFSAAFVMPRLFSY